MILRTELSRDECISRLVALIRHRPLIFGLSVAKSEDRTFLAGSARPDGIDAVVIDPLPHMMRRAATKVPMLAAQVGTVGVRARVRTGSAGSEVSLRFRQPVGDLVVWSAILAIVLSVVEWNVLDLVLIAPAFALLYVVGPVVRRQPIRRAEADVIARISDLVDAGRVRS